MKNAELYNKAGRLGAAFPPKVFKLFAPRLPRGNRLLVRYSAVGITGAEMAAVANRARQRKKGPLVRFGRRS